MKTSTITENTIEGIKKTTSELEDFRVQLALGKADAKDEYQELRSKFKAYLDESRNRLQHSLHVHDDSSQQVHAIFDELNDLLQTELFESKEVFELERQKLNAVLDRLKKELRESEYHDEHTITLVNEIEKFGIKTDMLHLKLNLLMLDNQEKLKLKKEELEVKLGKVIKRIEHKEESLKDEWKHFKSEMQEAFDHIREAFISL